MEELGVIAKVEAPTEWCAGMVVVPKSNGKVRICVDLTQLNQSVRRERHLLPAVDQTLAQLAGARIFSKLDANSGFWQIPLAAESALLTTFITPFGRFYFHRLPFGISSSPEHFQRRMSETLSGLGGVVCMMDDILIHGKSQEEHDARLQKVLQRLQDAGVTLNSEKCQFSMESVKFLGHVIDSSGIRPDPDKVMAIQKVQAPANVGDPFVVSGHGQPDEQIRPKPSRDHSAPERAAHQREPVGVGRTTTESLPAGKGSTHKHPCSRLVRSKPGNGRLS